MINRYVECDGCGETYGKSVGPGPESGGDFHFSKIVRDGIVQEEEMDDGWVERALRYEPDPICVKYVHLCPDCQ